VVGIRKSMQVAIALAVSLLWTTTALAMVTARVDRPTVDLNESFTLEVVVDSNTDLEPDLTILHESFFVGQISKLSKHVDYEWRYPAEPHLVGRVDAQEYGCAAHTGDHTWRRTEQSRAHRCERTNERSAG